MEIDFKNVTVVGFDADDTLWVNETYFREAEEKFASLLENYETKNKIDQELFKTVIKNLAFYGYGIKGFVLSMVECALEISNNTLSTKTMNQIINIGKEMIAKPVHLIDGVQEVLEKLHGTYRLILITKGDLLDQERKVKQSGLEKYFHHVEVMSDKKEDNYKQLLTHLQIPVKQFMMIGNSLKSDVVPLVNLGAHAVHIPFHTTWQHEEVLEPIENKGYLTIDILVDVLKYLK